MKKEMKIINSKLQKSIIYFLKKKKNGKCENNINWNAFIYTSLLDCFQPQTIYHYNFACLKTSFKQQVTQAHIFIFITLITKKKEIIFLKYDWDFWEKVNHVKIAYHTRVRY